MIGNGMELPQGRLRRAVQKMFFPERVVGHWNRLPRDMAMALSLPQLKERLEKALRERV